MSMILLKEIIKYMQVFTLDAYDPAQRDNQVLTSLNIRCL